MKKIIITGSSGFIGKQAKNLLEKKNFQIYSLRLHLEEEERHLDQIKQIQADSLLHFAWDTTPSLYWHTTANLQWLKASLNLLEVFIKNGGKRVVIAGSCAEMMPTTLYGACKEALRLSSEAFLRTQQVSYAWGRIFFPYGPHEKAVRLIPSLIQSLLAKNKFECKSQNLIRDFMLVEDVAKAFVQILVSEVQGKIEIGSGQGIYLGDLVQAIAHKMNAQQYIQLSSSTPTIDNPASLVAQVDRLYQEVGFTPSYSLDEGLDRTIQWWKEQYSMLCTPY